MYLPLWKRGLKNLIYRSFSAERNADSWGSTEWEVPEQILFQLFFIVHLGAQYPAQETDNTNTEKDSGAINFSILKSSVYLSQVKMKVKDKTDNCFL